ncbi:uncharacterized protein LOC116305849 [Actinia tenebrosa]|uniref:Uncharacterized protein LOC116305849 n=1 Tax=Actinia tenebrosa TaxID=6105 RepID=A0A6P8J0I3_ACTTE|nr:uncharacterized protein LOC116305849 [Actinia tenebrosa]
MAWFHSFFAICYAILFIFFVVPASGIPEVTEPYPGHVVGIEGENISITCVLIDLENDTTHDNVTKIEFYKITSRFGDKRRIVNDGKYSYDHKTDYFRGVPRWNGTLIINNITSHEAGQYECHVNDTYARYGFGISYIEKKDLPEIKLSEDKEVDFNTPVNLSCNLVKKGKKFSVKLVEIAWFKGNDKREEVKNLAENEKLLPNLTLNMEKPEDAGTYKCQLTSILRLQREYITTGKIQVKVIPAFPRNQMLLGDDNEIIKTESESATMNCGAKGNPIQIIWQKHGRSETTRTSLTQTTNSSKYIFDSTTNYEGFKLEIHDLDYDDRGEYYCCIKYNASLEKCQEFTLRVKDPLGWLWPLIGIICEAILIILILLIAAKFKAKKEKTYRSDANTELSYTISNEGSKGHIRLRNTGATTN